MLFSSPHFLFIFLPLTLILYYIIPQKLRNLYLLLASIFFYTWGEKELVIIIFLSTIIDYSAGLIIQNGYKKLGLGLSIVFNLGILIYFKYANFIYNNISVLLGQLNLSPESTNTFVNIVLPLGISFYTFQTMSYTIDVYRGHVKASKNFIDFATYVTLFPQLIAGPIVRYKTIEKELKHRTINAPQIITGIERFIIGLSKKLIISNNCAFLADNIFSLQTEDLSMPLAWLGIIAYCLQLYFDFSGYTDMAIGLGKMLGFNFPENFNFPYISKSVREFWKRWHITLSEWFRDYVYIPLGGNREGNLITYFNLLIVFLLTGIWHGANWTFIIWGLIHGFFITVEKLGLQSFLSKLPKFVSHIYLLLVILLSFVFFRSDTTSDAIHYINSMLTFNIHVNMEFLNYYLTMETGLALLLAILFSTRMPIKAKTFFKHSVSSTTYNYIKLCSLISLFVICFFYISIDSYNPFIYFRF